jgi:geranylgeranyl diphosphate synthase type I
MSLREYFATHLPLIEKEMQHLVGRPPDAAYAPLFGMLHYHHGWVDAEFQPANIAAGKRIRPALCLLVCEAAGGVARSALPAAAAIELLHNFSLIHDDVEDLSEYRRARLTVWKLWGMAQAINTGDALFTMSHVAFHRLSEYGVPAERLLLAHKTFSETCLKLTQGQYLDLTFQTRDNVSVEEYMQMIQGKTAALVAGACAIGAIVAGADAARIERFADFGLGLGLAFQILDDLLGIWGDPRLTGKASAATGANDESDISQRKKSLPVLHGLAQSEELRRVYAAPVMDVARAVQLLEQTGSKAYAEKLADEHTQKAMRALEAAQPQNEAGDALRALSRELLARQA